MSSGFRAHYPWGLNMVDVVEDLIEATDRDEKKHDIIDGVCIRHEKSVPAKFMCPFSPKNDAEQKERFLRRNFTPQFALATPIFDLENWLLRQVPLGPLKLFFIRMVKFTSLCFVKPNAYWVL